MKRFRPIFWLIAILLLAAMACNLVSGDDEPTAVPETDPVVTQEQEIVNPTATPLPPPTQAPADPPPTEPPPTEPPPTKAPAIEEPLTMAPEPASTTYVHPMYFFELTPPDGWPIDDENEGGTSFAEPNGIGYVEVEVTNTGTTLDGEAFERFVDGREINFFVNFFGHN